jgi:uncharacterized RmlC-like cupin family protein
MTEKNNKIKQCSWGYEIIWCSTSEYCGKILVFEQPSQRTPLHFHKNTSKSWFVNAGSFKVQWIDTVDGKTYAKELVEGDTFDVPAFLPVMLESTKPNSAMAEVSTGNTLNDYYRLN